MSQFVRRHIRVFALCAVVLALGGIVVSLLAGGPADPKPRLTEKPLSSPNLVQCTDPRPQICTMEYLPVCADLRDGTQQTYSSGCVACSDANVVGYRPDRCE